MMLLRRLFILTILALAACGDDGSGGDDPHGTVSSCDLTTDFGYCLDFQPTAPKDIAQQNCDNAKATVDANGVVNATASCPTANRVGSCAAIVTGVDTTYRYYSPKLTAAAAEENCNQIGGTFTPN